MSEWPGKNDVLYMYMYMYMYIPSLLPFTFQVDILRRFKPLHDGSKSTLLIYYIKLPKLLLLSVLKLPRKIHLLK